MSTLLLVAAVPYLREYDQTGRYRQRVQELLESVVLVSVVEDLDMFRPDMQRNGAGVADPALPARAPGAALEQEQERERDAVSRTVRQIGRDLRRIADELQELRGPPAKRPKGAATRQADQPTPSLTLCVTAAAITTGLAALLHCFLKE